MTKMAMFSAHMVIPRHKGIKPVIPPDFFVVYAVIRARVFKALPPAKQIA
jgi:hypothetical protein